MLIRVTEILETEGIDTFISSPYKRAMLTIEKSANLHEKEILVYENLKECKFSSEDKIISDKEVYPLVKKMFSNPDFALTEWRVVCGLSEKSSESIKRNINEFSRT